VRQIVVLRRGPERAYPLVGERGPQKQGREMACLGAKAPVRIGGFGLSQARLETGTTCREKSSSRSTSSPPSTIDTYRTSRSSFCTSVSRV
jgi:hypothetical protein